MPWASANRRRLTPLLPRSVGLGPVFSPAQGGFGHRPVPAQPTAVQTLQLIVTFQTHPPQLPEHPSGGPLLEAQVGGGAGADPRGVQGLPRAAGAQHRADAVGASPGALGGLRPGDGCSPLGKQRGQRFPQFIGYLEGAAGPVRFGLGYTSATSAKAKVQRPRRERIGENTDDFRHWIPAFAGMTRSTGTQRSWSGRASVLTRTFPHSPFPLPG